MKNSEAFKKGILNGIPIALGYLAVSFSLGIQCKEAGINSIYAAFMSLINLTSAGEFAAVGIIASAGSYLEMAVSQAVINLRYMLMSCALSQKVNPSSSYIHRFFIAFGVTDEIFGISMAEDGKLNPFYTYGAMLVAIPGWTLGTFLGVIFGNILPEILVNSLSVALYGMFIAIIIPPAKQKVSVAVAVIISMICSYLCTKLPMIKDFSSGTVIIILTVTISLIFALICPIDSDDNTKEEKCHE